jgi:nicotinamide mononucleotide transporter
LDFFQNIFSIAGYPISLIEFISVVCGIVAVYLAAKEKIINWPIGLINIITAFFIYFHVQLYSDMFLQCYYFLISIYGWYFWSREKENHIPLKILSTKQRIQIILIIIIGSLLAGTIISRLHLIPNGWFPKPAAYPYADSLVAVMSILANALLAKRYLENWFLWILVNTISVYLYIQKEIVFIAFEFFVFLLLAIYGLIEWKKLYKHPAE